MTLTPADIDRWDPAEVQAVSRAATARAESADAAAAALAQLPALAAWTGVAGEAARAAIGVTRLALEAHARESRAVARAADAAAEDIARLKAQLDHLDADTRAGGLMIDRDAATVLPAGRFHGTTGQFAAKAGPLMDRLHEIVGAAADVDAELARAVAMADAVFPMPEIPVGPTTAADTGRWWESLNPIARNQLLERNPEELGQRDGIPAMDRSIANVNAVTDDLERIEHTAAAYGVPVEQVLAQPHQFQRSRDDVLRYTLAHRVKAGMEYNRAQTGAEILLLCYRPGDFGGQGRATIAIGDPDDAEHTAVLVPGTGNSVANGWFVRSDAAAHLYNETVAATTESAGAADRPVSVLAWMGYDAPDAITDPRIAQTALARQGGELLAADVNALTLTRHGPSHVTVIGHSYGATTVADAAAGHGMRADDVVLVGAPGTDLAHSAADFGLPAGGHVYVGAAATDPVTNLAGIPGHFPGTELPLGRAGLGADPAADGFGSTRFKSEFGGWSWEPWADHDRYFESGSESLFSIAAIASGQGDELQEHGMTAPHRESILGPWATRLGLPSWSVPLMDPELLRPATTGHHHPARSAGS